MDERAGRGDSRSANASPTVHANALAGAKTISQVRYECAERGNFCGHVHIENWVGNEVHARCFGERAFVPQAKPRGFGWLKQRYKNFDSALPEAQEIFFKRFGVAGAQHNGQANRGISFDPEDIVQVFKLRQSARQCFLD
jgi:hypothetical protein